MTEGNDVLPTCICQDTQKVEQNKSGQRNPFGFISLSGFQAISQGQHCHHCIHVIVDVFALTRHIVWDRERGERQEYRSATRSMYVADHVLPPEAYTGDEFKVPDYEPAEQQPWLAIHDDRYDVMKLKLKEFQLSQVCV